MVAKAAELGLIKLPLLAIGQINRPLFSYKVSDGVKPLWDDTAFPDLINREEGLINFLSLKRGGGAYFIDSGA